MEMKKPCCAGSVARMVGRITLPDGLEVGILNLEDILKEVADLQLADAARIRKELLERARSCNYITASVEEKYAEGLYRAYEQRQTGTTQFGGISWKTKRPQQR